MTATLAAGTAASPPLPQWLKASEHQVLASFGGAQPVHTDYIQYPRKIAVIWTFRNVIRCGMCSSPSAAMQPRGRVIRVSFDRTTHALGGASNGVVIQFCEARGHYPPRSNCLHR